MKIENVEKLVANLHDKTECVMLIRNLKQALNHGLVSKKVYRIIKFNKNARLKPYIDMNNFEKDFFKLLNDAVLGKIMENLRQHREIKLVTTERRRNYLVSETIIILQSFSQKIY